MHEPVVLGTPPGEISFRLDRHNRYLDFLETELDLASSETEVQAVLSLLDRTKRTIARLEVRFVASWGYGPTDH